MKEPLRDIVIGVLVIVLAAVVVAFAGLPTRVSVVEKAQSDLSHQLDSMDKKLDALLGR